MWLKTSGRLIFDPDHKTNKHERQGSWKKTAMIFINDDLSYYYSWFIKKRFNLDLSTPLRGSHLTIINDKILFEDKYLAAKQKYDDTIVELEYFVDVRTDGSHWWLIAKCETAKEIRIATGLNSDPYYSFHITIGRPYDRQLYHSNYIHSLVKKYKGINM